MELLSGRNKVCQTHVHLLANPASMLCEILWSRIEFVRGARIYAGRNMNMQGPVPAPPPTT